MNQAQEAVRRPALNSHFERQARASNDENGVLAGSRRTKHSKARALHLELI